METCKEDMAALLERLHDKYNRPDFIEDDPISIPHRYGGACDRETAGLLASTIAWGNRKAIVRSARRMVGLMDDAPHDFVMNASDAELARLEGFVHRTFNGGDLKDFVLAMRRLYRRWGTLGAFFAGRWAESGDMAAVLATFRREFFAGPHGVHCEKHVSSVERGAACKRLCMWMRWMVRRDGRGVDFGIWDGVPMSALRLPLDVHAGDMGRALGLLSRRQNDWKAVEEITARLGEFDPGDPARFDFSLFGAGIDGFLKD